MKKLLATICLLGLSACTTHTAPFVEPELISDFAFVYDENRNNLTHVLSTISDLDLNTQVVLIESLIPYEEDIQRRMELEYIVKELNAGNRIQ